MLDSRNFKKNMCHSILCVIIPREEQGIKEFDDKEFLTRKTDKENKEFTSIKKGFFKAKIELLEGKKYQNLISEKFSCIKMQ